MAFPSNPSAQPRFSLQLVIPAFNPGREFEAFLPELLAALAATEWAHAVRVVDDGSDTVAKRRIQEVAHATRKRFPSVHDVLTLPGNTGKGAAVRAGWLSALADAPAGSNAWLAFVDADGSVPAAEVIRLAVMIADSPALDGLIASRQRVAGRTVERRWHRHVIGRVYAAWVSAMLGLDYYDTQCGLKFVRAVAYDRIRDRLRENRFSFDVELLCALRSLGSRIIEEPIDWADRGKSTVRLWRDAPAMAMGVLRVRRRFS